MLIVVMNSKKKGLSEMLVVVVSMSESDAD